MCIAAGALAPAVFERRMIKVDQIARIKHMEENLDQSAKAVKALLTALEDYRSIQEELEELAAYYSSALWRRDFEDDEAGKLPADLKRGVLSEDAVYDLLTENAKLIDTMQKIVEKYQIVSGP